MFKTLELPGALPPSPGLPTLIGFALDPLGALSGPQAPRQIILHPSFLISGYGPDLQNTIRFTSILRNTKFYKVHSFIIGAVIRMQSI